MVSCFGPGAGDAAHKIASSYDDAVGNVGIWKLFVIWAEDLEHAGLWETENASAAYRG